MDWFPVVLSALSIQAHSEQGSEVTHLQGTKVKVKIRGLIQDHGLQTWMVCL